MTLTELRQRLEELERQGHGTRSVEVSPAPPPVENWAEMSEEELRRYRLNFIVMNYVVSSVSINPLIDDPPVMLTFIEAREVPDYRDLVEMEICGF